MIGKTISHYKILEQIGSGGMGVVYKAQDTKLDRTVALKFLPPHLSINKEEKQRFIHEAKAAAVLDHPHICNIHEIGEIEEGQMFIAMAFYEGKTLNEKISGVGANGGSPLPLNDAIDITIQIAEGLQEAHQNHIVHRDIKSANIIITDKGQVKILDFGLAKLRGVTKLTKEGTTLGTVAYMSPEQASGDKVDHRSDIWSLGVLLYEMITGQLPFKGEYEQAIMYAIMNEEPEPITGLRTGVPVDLDRIINKLLAKDSSKRFQHADELIVDLKKVKQDSKPEILATKQKTKPEKIYKIPRRFLTIAGIMILLVMGFFLLKPLLFKEAVVAKPEPIVVTSFENQTGDNAYDYLQKAIPNLLITSLEQSPYFQVVIWEQMTDILRQMGKGQVEFIDKNAGFELCRREGINVIVLGSYVKAGDIFVTDAKVLDVESKGLLKSVSTKGKGVGSILESQIDDLSQGISRGIGLSERKIEKSRTKITDVTTTSLEAYRNFLIGKEYYQKYYREEAYLYFKKATEIDPTFAVAYLYLGYVYDWMGNVRMSNSYYTKAKQHSHKATKKERFYIMAAYTRDVEGNRDKQYDILKQIARKYPKEKRAYVSFGYYYDNQHLYDKAIQAFNQALKLDPQKRSALEGLANTHLNRKDYKKAIEYLNQFASFFPNEAKPYDSMGFVYFKTGRLDLALENFKKALSIKPDFVPSHYGMSYVHVLKEDYLAGIKWMEQLILRYPKYSPGVGAEWAGSIFYFFRGSMDKAFQKIDSARERAKKYKNQVFLGGIAFVKAIMCLDTGDIEKCNRLVQAWLDFDWNLNYLIQAYNAVYFKFLSGVLDLKKGDLASAKARLAEIKAMIPDLPSHLKENIRYLAELYHGYILLETGAMDKAIAICARAEPSELTDPGIVHVAYYWKPFLYASTRDVLARAYVKKGELDKAIAEYQRLITFDPDSEDLRFIHPRHHYRLATLYDQKGQSGKAIKQYERFLEIWKDADEDLPELIDARKRLKRLKGEG
jgi:serine/threonine protein kinase/Tfp pilus assembly protein PilF